MIGNVVLFGCVKERAKNASVFRALEPTNRFALYIQALAGSISIRPLHPSNDDTPGNPRNYRVDECTGFDWYDKQKLLGANLAYYYHCCRTFVAPISKVNRKGLLPTASIRLHSIDRSRAAGVREQHHLFEVLVCKAQNVLMIQVRC